MQYGAIFDADGTLLDSMHIWETAGKRCMQLLGIPAEESLAQEMAQMSLDESAAYMHEKFHTTQSPAEIKAGVLAVVADFYAHEAQPKAGVRAFLAGMHAHGIPMVIATSSHRAHIAAAMERLGFSHYFPRIFTCEEVGAGKRQPVIYQQAAEYLGLPPERVFVFEDVLHAVRAANAAGFVTVGVYDAMSAADTEKMRAECRIYLHDLTDFDAFRRIAISYKRSVST